MSYIVGRVEDGGLVQDWTRRVFADRREAAADAVEARKFGRQVEGSLAGTRVYALIECGFIED